ncbi:MAG: tyrosine-type recombinase/integrase, partial [Candidatus Micrarchaeaceae archaeon]
MSLVSVPAHHGVPTHRHDDDAKQMMQRHHRAVEELSEEQREDFRNHAAASFAASTRRNYASDHRCFVQFLQRKYLDAARLRNLVTGELDPRLAAWTDAIAWMQEMQRQHKKLSTINRRWSYLRSHLIPDLSRKEIHDEYQQILAGIRKQMNDGQMKGKKPLLMKHIHAILELLPKVGYDMLQRRTLLLFGFHSAMRRSELRAMRWNDVEFKPAGVVVRIPVSKTGVGQTITLNRRLGEYCPVRQLELWREKTKPGATSPVFRTITKDDEITEKAISIKAMVKYIKEACVSIDLPENEYGMHSLRSGMISTMADIPTVTLPQIMQVSR